MTFRDEKLDGELGELVRVRRLSSGLSQVELGHAAGISYQQIQKYESGANKISVSRLFKVSDALGMRPSALMAELERRLDARGDGAAEDPGRTSESLDFMASRRGQQLIRALSQCEDTRLIDAFVDLLMATLSQSRAINGGEDDAVRLSR